MNTINHIIISQIKNLGDVVLCLPVASLIKQALPECRITLLAQKYTFSIANNCPDIDDFIDWHSLEETTDKGIIKQFKNLNADVIMHFSVNKKIAKLAFKAGIKQRVGTCQRVFHWFYCNKLINQSRRYSLLHELQLNALMLAPLKIKHIKKNHTKKELINLMNLMVPNEELPQSIENKIDINKTQVILHPGSNGHGREWPMSHYIALAKELNANNVQVVFTGSHNEKIRFKSLIENCPFAIDTFGQLTLEQLMRLIDRCSLLLASGTGPVHISAALNKPTIGLFPPRKGISPRRWSPPGNKVTTLMHSKKKPCFSCSASQTCLCMAKITVQQVKLTISNLLPPTE